MSTTLGAQENPVPELGDDRGKSRATTVTADVFVPSLDRDQDFSLHAGTYHGLTSRKRGGASSMYHTMGSSGVSPPFKKSQQHRWIWVGGVCYAGSPSSIKIISWNCLGLGNPRAVRALRRLIYVEVPDVVFIMETRRFSHEMVVMRGMGGLGNLFPVSCSGSGRSRAGGVCMFWREGIDVDIASASLNHILCTLKNSKNGMVAQMLAVYGWPDDNNKWRTWEMVKKYKPNDLAPWFCIGNFNAVLSPDDKLGGGPVDIGRLQESA